MAEIFRGPDGTLDLVAASSTADQLKRRAQSPARPQAGGQRARHARRRRRCPTAVSTGSCWRRQTLTRLHRGGDALSLLAGREAADPRQAAALAWARAQAAEDAATAQRGRANLGSRRAPAAAPALAAVPGEGGPERRRPRPGGQGPQGALRRLPVRRAVRPRHRHPAPAAPPRSQGHHRRRQPLAARLAGVRQGELHRGDRQLDRALLALPARTPTARRGRYWTARAFDPLGEGERAQQIYNEIAQADTADFYRRNAVARLRGKPAAALAAAAQAKEPWPADPALDRARLLTDLGLDDLGALREPSWCATRPSRAPLRALEAVILARQGRPPEERAGDPRRLPGPGRPLPGHPAGRGAAALLPARLPGDRSAPGRPRNRLPAYLVFGIIRQESAFDANAQSWAGARGLMQLMPATARELAPQERPLLDARACSPTPR